MSSSLQKLPPELLSKIVKLLSREESSSFSRVSKLFLPLATSNFASEIALYPNDESVDRFQKLVSTPRLANAVRLVYIYTANEFYDEYDRVSVLGGDPDTEMRENFEDAMALISSLPNLISVTLQFDRYCGQEDGHWVSEPRESHTFRETVLKHLFKSIEGRWEDSDSENDEEDEDNAENTTTPPTIKNLSLIHLQNLNESVPRRELFHYVMSKLESLNLSIVNEIAVENGSFWHFARYQPIEFFKSLADVWFKPCLSTLKHLTLSSDMRFGLVPQLQLGPEHHFPHLRSLTLGNFAFAYDWQLEWILSHNDIELLHFRNCAIVYHITLEDVEEVNLQGYEPHSQYCEMEPPVKGAMEWSYEKRWHQYFSLIQQRLPRLRDFRFIGQYHPTDRPDHVSNIRHIEEVERCMDSHLTAEMYLFYDERRTMMDCEVFVTEDLDDPEEWGRGGRRVKPDCEKEDMKALMDLNKAIGMRVLEN